MLRRPRSVRLALGLAIVLLGGAVSMQPVAADGVSDQQAEVKRILAQIDSLNQKHDQYAELGAQALDQKAQLDAEIVVSQGKIASQQLELNTLSSQLSDVAVQRVMGGGSGAMGPLFTDPAAIEDGLQRDHLTRVAVNAGAATTDDYESLLKTLDQEQKLLEKKQKKATDLAANAEKNRVAADQAAADATNQLAAAKAKLGVLVEQEQQRQAAAAQQQFDQQLKQQQAAAAAAAAAAAVSKPVVKKPAVGAGSGAGNNGSASGGAGSNNGGGGAVSGGAGSSSGAGSGSGSGSGSGDGSGASPDAGSGGGASVPVSGQAGAAISAAESQIGIPYRFGAMEPGVAFDCSGITAWAWGRAGVSLPHQSAQQYASIPHVPVSEAQPGDLIFSYSPISHVGIYLGNGQMIHSPQTGSFVSYTTVRWATVSGVGRPG